MLVDKGFPLFSQDIYNKEYADEGIISQKSYLEPPKYSL